MKMKKDEHKVIKELLDKLYMASQDADGAFKQERYGALYDLLEDIHDDVRKMHLIVGKYVS